MGASCRHRWRSPISTTQDYARFAEMLRCGGQLDGVEVLKLDTVRALIRDQIPGLTVWDQEAVGYGLGVGMLRAMDGGGWAGEPRAFHWSGVHGTGFFVDLDMELTVVLMTQAQPRARELEREVRSIVVRTVRGY